MGTSEHYDAQNDRCAELLSRKQEDIDALAYDLEEARREVERLRAELVEVRPTTNRGAVTPSDISEHCDRCGDAERSVYEPEYGASFCYRCAYELAAQDVVSLRQRLAGAVTPADIVAWLRGRTGAHGGGFTSADDVADAIEREFTDAR